MRKGTNCWEDFNKYLLEEEAITLTNWKEYKTDEHGGGWVEWIDLDIEILAKAYERAYNDALKRTKGCR